MSLTHDNYRYHVKILNEQLLLLKLKWNAVKLMQIDSNLSIFG